MFKVQHVSIEGLWGVKNFDTDFNSDISILIGPNGSNKTIFLSLIESCLTCEVHKLSQISFRTITFSLKDDSTKEQICIQRLLLEEWIIIRYIFDDEKIDVRVFCDYDEPFYRSHSVAKERVCHIRELLKQKINMTWLSVDRYTENQDDLRRTYRNVVDKKLDDLLRDLVTYRQSLVEQVNKRTMELYSKELSLLLYDESTDNFDIERITQFTTMDPDDIKTHLFRVFGQIGLANELRTKILNHISKLSEAIERVRQNGELKLNDVAALVLINRTMRVLELSKKYKEECELIMGPVDLYCSILSRFIKDKSFSFSEEQGRLQIGCLRERISQEQPTTFLSPYNLSSGEKQILILLTQTLLQEKKPYIYIADEPELSLHIAWQKTIIGAIHTLNPNAQIIIATHSPEIAGRWPMKIISMESITHYD